MVFISMYQLLKLKKIPTKALYYKVFTVKTSFTVKATTCFDLLWVILRDFMSVFV
jgi:hypothetical protein